jgi:hypothetical protein
LSVEVHGHQEDSEHNGHYHARNLPPPGRVHRRDGRPPRHAAAQGERAHRRRRAASGSGAGVREGG